MELISIERSSVIYGNSRCLKRETKYSRRILEREEKKKGTKKWE